MPSSLRTLLESAPISLDVAATSLDETIVALVQSLVDSGALAAEHRDSVVREVLEREHRQSTVLGQGVAVPHGFLPERDHPLVAFARLRDPIDAGAPDGENIEFVYLITGGRADAELHLELLMSIARLQADPQFRLDVDDAITREQVLDAFDGFFARREAPGSSYLEMFGGMVASNRQAGFGHTRRIGEGQVIRRDGGLRRKDLDLSGPAFRMVGERLVFQAHVEDPLAAAATP